jgi:hypothetical protein
VRRGLVGGCVPVFRWQLRFSRRIYNAPFRVLFFR